LYGVIRRAFFGLALVRYLVPMKVCHSVGAVHCCFPSRLEVSCLPRRSVEGRGFGVGRVPLQCRSHRLDLLDDEDQQPARGGSVGKDVLRLGFDAQSSVPIILTERLPNTNGNLYQNEDVSPTPQTDSARHRHQ
jgi:hypothetical protein